MRRHHVIRGLAIAGPIIVAQTILWEMARMNPGYGFLVAPWALRGWETIHGTIYLTIGLALLGAVLLVLLDASRKLAVGVGIVAAIVMTGTVITAVFASDDMTLSPNVLLGIVLALVIAFVLNRIVRDEIGTRVEFLRSGIGPVISLVVLIVVAYLVLNATFIGKEITTKPALAMAAVLVLLAGLALAVRPRQLAANRMLILVAVVAWMSMALQAGAMRSALVQAQINFTGEAYGIDMTDIVTQYKDTQVTSGWFLMNFGMLLLFIGAVAMWAGRRDTILNQQRAQRQREAAEKSAAEIREALEAQGLLRS